MSAETIPIPPARSNALETPSLSSQSSSLPLWDRITTWASENKAVVYTLAGVVVVASGAGVIYYLSDSRKDIGVEDKKRASKKERRKAKKDREREQPEARETPKQTGNNATSTIIYPLTIWFQSQKTDSLLLNQIL